MIGGAAWAQVGDVQERLAQFVQQQEQRLTAKSHNMATSSIQRSITLAGQLSNFAKLHQGLKAKDEPSLIERSQLKLEFARAQEHLPPNQRLNAEDLGKMTSPEIDNLIETMTASLIKDEIAETAPKKLNLSKFGNVPNVLANNLRGGVQDNKKKEGSQKEGSQPKRLDADRGKPLANLFGGPRNADSQNARGNLGAPPVRGPGIPLPLPGGQQPAPLAQALANPLLAASDPVLAANNSAMNQAIELVGSDNIEITQDLAANGDKQFTVALSKDIEVESVSADTISAKEITVEHGPAIAQSGIDMADKRIKSVADGKAPQDAVNVSQLNNATAGVQAQVSEVRKDVRKLDNKLSAGVAAAMATAALPQAYMPGKSMAAMAGGTWNGQTGMAIGVSTVSGNGKWVVKVAGNTTSRGDYGGAVGVGYQW